MVKSKVNQEIYVLKKINLHLYHKQITTSKKKKDHAEKYRQVLKEVHNMRLI